MRGYGRFLKNISAMLLLVALLSLLLPFCHFQAKGQDITLSGIEVLTAGGKAGYVYWKDGEVPQDFVLKAPITYGDLKEAVAFADQAAGSNLLMLGTVAITLPIILCFLAMCMLFLAEGKKTMFFPTLFMCITTVETLLLLAAFYQLAAFFLIGLYLFIVLHAVALVLVMLGWITGGYRKPKQEEETQDGRQKDDRRRRSDRDHSRRKSHRKKKSKDKSKSKKKDSNSAKEEQKTQSSGATAVSGKIGGGTGIYQGISWDLENEKNTGIMIGTTADAMQSIQAGSWKNMRQMEMYSCTISYDPVQKQYTIISHSKRDILLWQDGNVTQQLKMGDHVKILHRTILQLGSGDTLHLY